MNLDGINLDSFSKHASPQQQFYNDVTDRPKEKIEELEKEIIQELHRTPLTSQRLKKIGAVAAMSIAVGIAFIFEGIRTIGGLRDKIDTRAERLLLKYCWNSHPLPPEAAKKVAEKFNELERIYRNNKQFAEFRAKGLREVLGKKEEIYKEVSQCFGSITRADYWTSVANGSCLMMTVLADFKKIEALESE
jgi:hypothetical protein